MLGIDVNEVVEVKIEDAVFKVGVVPYGVRLKLEGSLLRYSQESEDSSDKMFAKNYEQIITENVDWVKYGIRGHSNIKDKTGKEIPFKFHKEKVGTRELIVVDDEIIDLYMMIGIASKLFLEVKKFNTLTRQEEKNL